MYRCEVCRCLVGPRQSRRTYLLMRDVPRKDFVDGKVIVTTRKEIAREVPLCGHCYGMLKLGCTFEQLIEQRGKKAEAVKAEVVVVETVVPEAKVVPKPTPVRPIRLLMGVPVNDH